MKRTHVLFLVVVSLASLANSCPSECDWAQQELQAARMAVEGALRDNAGGRLLKPLTTTFGTTISRSSRRVVTDLENGRLSKGNRHLYY